MPHRPEDTSFEPPQESRPGETRDLAVEGSRDQPRATADTQPPAPINRPSPGQIPHHGSRK